MMHRFRRARRTVVGGVVGGLLVGLTQMQPLLASVRGRVGQDTEGVFLDLLLMGLGALLVAALLSPLETLGWWAGWYGDRVEPGPPGTPEEPLTGRQPSRYIVYLDGIGQFQATYAPEAEQFLSDLGQALPDMVIVRGIMPYSVLDRPLVADRPMSAF